MNFFQHQDAARRNTFRLVILLGLAITSLIIITNLLVMIIFGFLHPVETQGITIDLVREQFDWSIFFLISLAVIMVIVGGSVYKTLSLSAGGKVVAESLGGTPINPVTKNLHERKLLNVVEEMAIASGIPVPTVYLLEDEPGINAFAAGFSSSDAVIGVTRGTVEILTRDELQGVIAHEFSHILNGDMRLNLRLIGILHGILLIGLIGYYILRSVRGSRKNAGPVIGLGLGLLVIGYSGTFFGNLIKASVSRQREYLADASAVQFTRNNLGIASALKKIGGYEYGSELNAPQAPSMSHAYFSNGVSSFMQSIFATHPPLDKRISRIDPHWDGQYPSMLTTIDETESEPTFTEPAPAAAQPVLPGIIITDRILDSIGQIRTENIKAASDILTRIPSGTKNLARHPQGASTVIYALLISADPVTEKNQREYISQNSSEATSEHLDRIIDEVKKLPISLRLPVIEISLPALRNLSKEEYLSFTRQVQTLIEADNRINLFEWSLQKILFHHLEPIFNRASSRLAKFNSLQAVSSEINTLLSMLIHTCIPGEDNHAEAIKRAAELLHPVKIRLLPRNKINLTQLNYALDQLALLKPLLKPRLLKACLALITLDNHYSNNEIELMRAISDTLDCPVPLYIQ